MRKEDLLKLIAETAYNVGFGAKKHFATYDIVEKAPGWIGAISMFVGVFALVINYFAEKHISAFLIVFGVAGLYINFYNETKQSYEQKGVFLTQLFNELKVLYLKVKASDKSDFSEDAEKLSEIESRYYSNCISKQILFSDWYAHYKFFWQHQIDWVNEQKQFKFWRDKIPLSFVIVVSIVILGLIAFGCCAFFKRVTI